MQYLLRKNLLTNQKLNIPPEFSIIIAVFNGSNALGHTIVSVLNQTYSNFELIIVDGGSTDNTIEVIQRFECNIAYWVSEPDSGVYDAWNKGLAKSKGRWISFLGAGDEYKVDALAIYHEFISLHPSKNFDYISSKVALVHEGNLLRILGKKWEWVEFRRAMLVAHVGSIHNSSLYERLGSYNKSYKIVGDYELLLRSGNKLKAGYIDVITANMGTGGISDSYSAILEAARAKYFTAKLSMVSIILGAGVAIVKLFLRRRILKFKENR
jgi:glycosyltransferase involved in cell wall biosynthesis